MFLTVMHPRGKMSYLNFEFPVENIRVEISYWGIFGSGDSLNKKIKKKNDRKNT